MNISVRTRFTYSLFGSVAKGMLSFVTGLAIARGLGPEQFGNMTFLLGTFVAIRQFLDCGSSSAFFTCLSQRPRSRRFVAYFMVWIAIQFIVPFLAIGVLLPDLWLELIWKGEQRSLVLLALAASFMQFSLWPVMGQMGEAQRLTGRVQGVGVAIAVLHFGLIALSWWLDFLSVQLVLAALVVEWALGAWLMASHLHYDKPTEEAESLRSVINQLSAYFIPLIPMAWLGFAHEFADRWLLQTYGGSVQQAYFAVGGQFAVVANIAAASVMNIYWKEVSESHYLKDMRRVAAIFGKLSRLLYMIPAVICGFVIPWSDEIVLITLGKDYLGGSIALAIMFLYPVHQSLGQLGGILLSVTGHLREAVRISMLFMVLSIVASYLLLAPTDAAIPGIAMGGAGLAIKMVLIQVLSTGAFSIYISKNLNISADWFFQIGALGLALISGWCASLAAKFLAAAAWPVLATMALAGLMHVALIALAILAYPGLVGAASRREINWRIGV